MIFIGIDISKLTFNVAVLRQNKVIINEVFENNKKGFEALFKLVKKLDKKSYYCLEATGIYSLGLAKFLSQKKQAVILANPIKTNAFCKMEMSRNKTDKADARRIAAYCAYLYSKGEIVKHFFTPKGVDFERLQFLSRRLEQLTKLKSQEGNRLESTLDEVLILSIQRILDCINDEYSNIVKEMQAVVKNNKMLSKQVELLVSIAGIGEKTALVILSNIGDISFFSSAKQVTSFAGLNPKIEESGTSLQRSSLSKMGNHHLRKSLYMPALVATKHNPLMKALYERLLAKGKPKKVALCAVMRKLLVLSYGVLKSEKPFDLSYGK